VRLGLGREKNIKALVAKAQSGEAKKASINKKHLEAVMKRQLDRWEREFLDKANWAPEEEFRAYLAKLAKENLGYDHQRKNIKVADALYEMVPALATAVRRGTNANEHASYIMIVKEFADRYMWSEVVPYVYRLNRGAWEAIKKHEAGDYYVHKHPDAAVVGYCVGHDIRKILKNGLRYTGQITSRPPKHLLGAVNQVKEFLIHAQGFFTGAQAVGAFEMWMAPFIRYDKADEFMVKQAIENFYYELNHPWRVGGQSPFTNNTIYWLADKSIQRQSAIIDGKETGDKLEDFEDEVSLLFKTIFRTEAEGDALGAPFTYPIQNVMMTKDLIKWIEADPERFKWFYLAAGLQGAQYFENAIVGTRNVLGEQSYIDPEVVQAMCYHRDDRLLIRYNDKVESLRFEEMFERFAGEAEDEKEGWYKVKEPFEVLAYIEEEGRLEWRPVKAIRKKKPKDGRIYRIELTDGRYIRVDADHTILYYELTEAGNEGASRFRLGRARAMKAVKFAELVKEIKEKYKNPGFKLMKMRVPQAFDVELGDGGYVDVDGVKIDEDLAYLLGIMYAEATIYEYENGKRQGVIYLGKNDKETAPRVLEILTKYIDPRFLKIYYGKGAEWIGEIAEKFGIDAKPIKDTPATSGNVRIHLKEAARSFFLDKLGIRINKKRGAAGIPWFIWQSPKSVRLAFIQGFLDGDGYFRVREKNGAATEYWDVHLGGPSKPFAEEFMTLLAVTGVPATYHERENGTITIYIVTKRNSKKSRHSLREGQLAFVAVRKVEEEEYDDYVYDVEVDAPKVAGVLPAYVLHLGVLGLDCCRGTWGKLSAQDRVLARAIFGVADETGSKGIVTLNLPRYAMECKGDKECYLQRIEEEMRGAALEWLKFIHKWYLWLRWRGAPDVFRFINFYQPYYIWRDVFNLTFGAMGMTDAAHILADEDWRVWKSEDWGALFRLVRDYVKPAIVKMKDVAISLREELMDELGLNEGLPYDNVPDAFVNVEEVPAETAGSKLLLKDLKKFGREALEKYVNLTTMEEFGLPPTYVNTIVPYYAELPIEWVAKLEGMVQRDFTGGVMHHFRFADRIRDPEIVAKIVKMVLGYGVINFSITPRVCTSEGCFTRIVGWMVKITNFSDYRKAEFTTRIYYDPETGEMKSFTPDGREVRYVRKDLDVFAGIL